MSQTSQSSVGNNLVSALDAADFALLQPHLQPVTLERGLVLSEPGRPITDIYIPSSGICSVIAISPEGECAEVALFGRDGISGTATLLGSDSAPHRVLVQVPGSGYRLSAQQLHEAMGESSAIRELLLRYVHALGVQTAHTALSNAIHSVEERLARWLLMTHDRTDGDEIPLTHEFLAIMLAVRRPSVTTALHVVEGMQLIRAKRGLVTIRDRAGLEEFAQDTYGVPEAEYERLIGALRKPRQG